MNPSRSLVLALMLVAAVALVLGLATDVGLFGWTLSALLVLYLGAVGVARAARR